MSNRWALVTIVVLVAAGYFFITGYFETHSIGDIKALDFVGEKIAPFLQESL